MKLQQTVATGLLFLVAACAVLLLNSLVRSLSSRGTPQNESYELRLIGESALMLDSTSGATWMLRESPGDHFPRWVALRASDEAAATVSTGVTFSIQSQQTTLRRLLEAQGYVPVKIKRTELRRLRRASALLIERNSPLLLTREHRRPSSIDGGPRCLRLLCAVLMMRILARAGRLARL